MAISDHFLASDVMLDVSVRNKRDLFEILAAKAASRLACSTPEIVDALQSREDLGSTALGRGVALPHAELQGAALPIVIFARLCRPIEFDGRDDEPVDLVFLVLWPADATKGLIEVMSDICRALRDSEVLRRLRIIETSDDVVQLMRNQGGLDTALRTLKGEE